MDRVIAKQLESSAGSRWNTLWADAALPVVMGGPSYRHKQRLMMALLRKYGVGRSILDVACGTGTFLSNLSHCDRRIGIDVSRVALEEARSRDASVEWRQHDIETESLSESFDSIVCMNALEEMPNDRAALQHMGEMLSREGHLFLVVPHSLRYWSVQDEDAGNQRRYECDDLRRLLQSHGFEVCEQILWGWPIYAMWYRLTQKRRMSDALNTTGKRKLALWVGAIAYRLLWLDDLFRGNKRSRILLTVARKTSKA